MAGFYREHQRLSGRAPFGGPERDVQCPIVDAAPKTQSPVRPPGRLSVEITDLQDDGRGRGRHGSQAVVLPQAYPGEVVEYRVDVASKGALQGRVLLVQRKSRDRVAHPCAHEFRCTGCPLLSYAPEAEAAFKSGLVRAALALVPGLAPGVVRPIVVPAGPFHYRYFAKQQFAHASGTTFLGSFVHGTHVITDNAHCPVVAPGLAGLLDTLASIAARLALPVHRPADGERLPRRGLRHVLVRQSRATGQLSLVVASSSEGARDAEDLVRSVAGMVPDLAAAWVSESSDDGNNLLQGALRHVYGAEWIEEELLGHRYRIGPRTFFQINPAAAEVIFGTALEWAGSGTSAVEFHAGVGALTLPLATRFARVTSIEASADAVALAQQNLLSGGRTNVAALCGDAAALAPAVLERERPEVVILDPPRKGLGPELIGLLAGSTARRVVLVSCDPAALGRDAKGVGAAGFRVAEVLPVDQFPLTSHFECITRFEPDGPPAE